MVVEHAERFGLAALHQLRGRVGRGTDPAYAFFVYDKELTPQAAERLRALREHADGFALADLDLALRGPGELAGTRQTGLPPLRAARLADDLDLMRQAQADARRHHRCRDTAPTASGRPCG
jgi:ATP-dependent DNA helicase RecG